MTGTKLHQSNYLYTKEDPKKWNLFIKNCVFILTCLNFSHLQHALHLMYYTYGDFIPLIELIDFDAF